MTKVTIIDIELGIDVDKIISENIEALTDKSKKELDMAIDIARQRDKLREREKLEKANTNDAMGMAMELVYAKLADAGQNGVPCDEILDNVKDHVQSPTAFSIRMKKILRDRGNPYSLSRKKINGIISYLFTEFNKEE